MQVLLATLAHVRCQRARGTCARCPTLARQREFSLGVGEFALELAFVVDQRLQPLRGLARWRAQQRRKIGVSAGIGLEPLARLVARLGFDAPYSGGDRAFADDGDEADVAGAVDMSAAAKLDRIGPLVVFGVLDFAHGDDAHLVAVFLAEQSASAGRARIVEAHEPRRHLGVFQHNVIGDVLDFFELGARDWLRVGDVEAQPLGRNQRALLRHMIAEHHAQSFMQDVGRRMVGARRRARVVIDLKLDR